MLLDMKECEEQMMYTTTRSQSLQVGQALNLVNGSDVSEGNVKEHKYGNRFSSSKTRKEKFGHLLLLFKLI